MMPFNPVEVASELARAITSIRSWQQVVGLALIVGGGVYLFASPSEPKWDGRFNSEQQDLITKTQKRLNAKAIVLHALDSSTLHPIYSSDPQIEGKDVYEGFYYGAFKALRLGNCFRSEGFAKSAEQASLGVIGCPVFQNGELVASISAVFLELPPKNISIDEDINDPTAAALFILGTELR